tara:strand:+ start:330 stop:1451 length:1122 start_codon:yes stop_codon:yes gene_type:complete
MTKKKFKIKPKTWPKEYTFEEFKSLNSSINENVLINYYNQYLQEYSLNHSRHITHFNDTKKIVSEEVKKLQNHWNFEAYDSMVDRGEGGIGREYLKNKYSSKSLLLNVDNGSYGLTTKPEALKPELLTLSIWFKKDGYAPANFSPINTFIDNYRTTNYGWELRTGNGSIAFVFRSSKGGGSGTGYTYDSGYRTFANDSEARHYYDITGPSGNGWIHLVVTMDGRYLKMYVNGELEGNNGGIDDLDGADGHTIYYGADGSPDQIAAIGGSLISNTAAGATMNGLLDGMAIWNTALDADTIKTIYNNGVPKHDLNVNVENLDSRDGHDLLKPYADHLIAWWRFEEIDGTTIKDHSPSGNHLELTASPSLSTSTPE